MRNYANVTTTEATRKYGEANPIFELVYDGFVLGDSKDNLLVEPTASTAANASSEVNSYGGPADYKPFKVY